MSKDIADLMKPRRRLTINFPGNIYRVGSIFTLRGGWWFNDEHGQGIVNTEVEKCSEIFQPLSWWEDREPGEMPEYLRINETVYKIEWWEHYLGWVPHEANPKKDSQFRVAHHFDKGIPATEQEYNDFLQSQKAKP